MQLQDVEKMIRNGEAETVEFKRSTGQRTTAAKTLCGMLNETGGMSCLLACVAQTSGDYVGKLPYLLNLREVMV
jgi:predicted HTH transcriptional regulator